MENRNYLNEYSPSFQGIKTYVCVKAYFNTQGVIIPECILWEDGRKFDIDKVTDSRPASSLRGGGCGIRYTCRIRGQETYLFLDGSRWFVERKIREM